MADDLEESGAQAGSRINVNEPHEVRYWTQHLDVSERELRKAVADVGVSARQVAEQLGKRWMEYATEHAFEYGSVRFTLKVTPDEAGVFLPHVHYVEGIVGMAPNELPIDAGPYDSAAEAWRHAEQQAVRWVHDQTGDGRGRF
ncbi:DUF3606 domain-containing protein [Polaromonas sp.]|uniref:DUF3606 domain-containing protein n=1 Tax=Polaromonas sp. TaxID=1869339 RepID=UPI00352A4017